ncbi:hypothetical protein EI427_17710 [Flammeovirga pectinis]|uniref:DUF4369 domain-containing protein n=1 Tax=Flammeovirga pectinis TaxID=2494373 RepID=A0A3Q9FR19_9BACT|nr:hypothetical protein [Flammeovirga pectinis]AZQ63994.1 hypothetical protein EI427_17710 [Flammeovirga pectinis]
MKTIGLITFIFTFSLLSFAQDGKSYIEGTISKDGQQIEGYIWRMGTTTGIDLSNESAPWEFQKTIRFISKEDFKSIKKVKYKYFPKVSPKDCDGYTYEGQFYEAVKYADMSAAGAGMIAKRMFMKRISVDQISIYQHFDEPDVLIDASTIQNAQKPHIVYRIGKEGKLKIVHDMNVKKELADCQFVLDKYEKGQYKLFEKKDSNLLKKLANTTVSNHDVRMQIIEDYNANCGNQEMK